MRFRITDGRWVASLLAVWAAGGPAAVGQQLPDPAFDAKVATPAYVSKHPTVLFDEAHFNVHTAAGGYKTFADLVTSDGYKLVTTDKPFSAATLAGADVLVVANPGAATRSERPAFTAAECDAVADWVRAGGGLLLVTDHYPIGHAAEVLGTRLGVSMSKGRTEDAANRSTDPAGGPSQLQFSRENKLLKDHPITNGRDKVERVEKVVTFTGQSLKGPDGSVSFLSLADTAVDVLPAESNKQVSAAGRSQGLAFTLGKGRVVVLGEASQLSAQVTGPRRRPMGMNFPGIDNRKMAVNIMHWLSGLLD